jgi:23S rRNA pseudouridine1911/1915/1917 synthase
MIEKLWENDDLLVVNKPAGVPVQEDKTGDPSVLNMLGKPGSGSLYLVHRIDRPVSGALLLTRSATSVTLLQNRFKQHKIKKLYLAAVSAPPPEEAGTLTHFLKKDGLRKRAEVVEEGTPDARKAVLHYKVLDHSTNYHLLLVELESGRFHQIRAQLAAIGCPIKGDVKYGARRSNPDRSIHLHAWQLEWNFGGEQVQVKAPLPAGDGLWEHWRPLVEAL